MTAFASAQEAIGMFALGSAAYLWLRVGLPAVQDEIDAHRALRLNRGRRASDRLEVVDGYQQVDVDGRPLDEEERAA